MLVRIVGGHGGVSPGFKATSYLIDGVLLIDAGSIASSVPITEQVKVDHILISHSHLDHITDLAFIADNCFGQKGKPFEVYANKEVKGNIMKHLLNNAIWPDFSILPNKENPTLRMNILEPEQEYEMGDYKVTSVPVNHPGGAQGFIVSKGDKTIVFTQDTGPTDRIWELAAVLKNLQGIFTEVSFPNDMQKLATESLHHTPKTLTEEIKKMPKDVPIFLGHIKPNYQDLIFNEVDALKEERITLLSSDDTNFIF